MADKDGKKVTYVEKRIYKYTHYVEAESERRKFEIKRSNNNLILAGMRWSDKYKSFSIVPSSKFLCAYDDGVSFLINLLDSGLIKLNNLIVDKSEYGSEVVNISMTNGRGDRFEIVLKANEIGDLKLFFVVTSESGRDIIPYTESELTADGVETDPFYVRVVRDIRDKLHTFANDFEAQDKFNYKMVKDKEVNTTPADTKKSSNVDDFAF